MDTVSVKDSEDTCSEKAEPEEDEESIPYEPTEYAIHSEGHISIPDATLVKSVNVINSLPPVEEDHSCIVCASNGRNAAFKWCKHLLLCDMCMEALPTVGRVEVLGANGKTSERATKMCPVCSKPSIYDIFFMN